MAFPLFGACSYFLTMLNSSQAERRHGRGAKVRAKTGGERSQARADFGRRTQGVRAGGTRRRLITRDRGRSGLHAGRTLFPFRLERSDLRRGAARIDRAAAGGSGTRGSENALARGKIARGGDGFLRFLYRKSARSRSRLLSLSRRDEAARPRQGTRQAAERSARLRAAIDFRRGRGTGRKKGRR